MSRELARNGGRHQYRAERAATQWARRSKVCKLAHNLVLRRVVKGKLADRWSTEQTSGWLPVAYPDDEAMRVSHETIYLSLFIQSRGLVKRD